MIPTVGRIVHYQAYGTPGGEYQAKPRAAIITEVISDVEVMLCVFNPSGVHWNKSVYSEEPKPGTWHWPNQLKA